MINGYGAVDGMKIGRGNRNTRREPTPVPLCSHIPYDLTLDRTRATVESLFLYLVVKYKVVPVLNELSITPWRRMGEWQ
jgi:hypothetical protein